MSNTEVRIIADRRWVGTHGIGRFANEVLNRIPHEPLQVESGFTSPLDVVKTSLALRFRHEGRAHFFTPGYNPVVLPRQNFSITLHDLIHLDVNEESSPLKRAYYNHFVLPAVRRAHSVFTVSKYSKQRIVEWSGVEEHKVVVVGNGVDGKYFANNEAKALSSPYFLYVGNQKFHKNVELLISAFANCKLSADMLLVVSGTLEPRLVEMAYKLGVLDRIVEAGSIPEDELPTWYRGAKALVMPSLYEGFGLPVAEAMASRTLVISSNRTSLPEVAGEAALYFDPQDEESLVYALEASESSSSVDELIAIGFQRARQFDWDVVAGTIFQTIAM